MNAEQRMRTVFAANHGDVVRFAQRRTGPERAEDIAAETFLVVWRRIEEVPVDPGDARAWLFGVARNCLLNDRRSERRRDGLAVRLAEHPAPTGPHDPADVVAPRLDLTTAWRRLSDDDQEVLALAVFEQLSAQQAAVVLGTSAGAVRVRLSRARARLRTHLESPHLSAHSPEVSR